jgi:hypothetical protein
MQGNYNIQHTIQITILDIVNPGINYFLSLQVLYLGIHV